MVLLKLLISAGGAVLLYGLWKLVGMIWAHLTSPLRDLPGPPNSSLIYGNFREIWKADHSVKHEEWIEQYGKTIKYRGFFSSYRLYTTDPKALNHILAHNYDYQKPETVRYSLTKMMGEGVLMTEGDIHKQQRRIMNPAFGPIQIRELTSIFVQKANQLRDIWLSEIAKKDERPRINVLSWLSRMTLDVIGLAGFDYKFDNLNDDGKSNELNDAFSTIFSAGMQMNILPMLQMMIPILRLIPSQRDRAIANSRATMKRIGDQLLEDAKDSVYGNEKDGTAAIQSTRRDLLSLLVKANMAMDLPASQRLTDDAVLAQVPTFLIAGHETTANATTWALFALTQMPEAQTKLREELLKVSTDEPSMDELNALPYLDAIVRETLRLHAPVASTVRVAMKDDIVPLENPITDKHGQVLYGIRVKKGDHMLIPILAMNRSKAIWGDDSMEFKPERWESLPDATKSMPGVWGNMLTFLGGPRACIGYRFSLIEMKALLFSLVRSLEFELAVPTKDIVKKTSIVQRPIVVSEPDGGNQMPMFIRPHIRS